MSSQFSPCSLCNQAPCSCQSLPECVEDPCANLCPTAPVNPDYPCSTVCTGDTSNNIWFEPGPPGFPGKCKLDLLTYEQVIAVLQRVPCARRDLLRITTDPCLVELANKVPLLVPEQEENKAVADRLMRNSLPFYTLLRGNIDGSCY